MEDLYIALHQHVQLAILERTEAVIIERLSAPQALGVMSRVGGRLPRHYSCVGKILLSHAGPDLVREVLDGEVPRFTARMITEPDVIRRELAECRRTGSALVCGELTEDADSIATRIMNSDGRVVASLAVVVRTGLVQSQAVLPSAITCGLAISRTLGWCPGIRIREG